MQATEHDLATRASAGLEAALAAGEAAMARFGTADLGLESKGDGTPVTLADREAERVIRGILADRFPDDTKIGEEYDDDHGDSPYRWIIDPIDGTFSFSRAVPLFATLIALQDERRIDETGHGVVFGVIHIPGIGETVHATRGGGARWLFRGEERPARVSAIDTLDRATVCYTSLEHFRAEPAKSQIERVLHDTKHSRGWCDAFAPLLLATGRCDIVLEKDVQVWDVAPWPVIIEEAGGRYSDWAGGHSIDGGSALATNARLHDEVLGLLRA
ncbi:MAG: inositol monophosphatase family protein [Planctomycetota bacterium]